MNLAVLTDEISRDIATASEILNEKGIKNIDLRSLRTGRIPYIDTKEEFEIRNYVKKYSFKVNSISPGIGKLSITESDLRKKTIKHLKDSIDFAKRNNIYKIIVFSFKKINKYDLNEKTPEFVYDLLYEMMQIGEENGVEILLENHSSCYISTIDTIEDLYKDERFKNKLKLNWDPNNSFQVDKKTYKKDQMKTFIDRVENVHVKDTAFDKKFVRKVLGQGDVGWSTIFNDLVYYKYDKMLTIETHYEPFVTNTIKDINEINQYFKYYNFL